MNLKGNLTSKGLQGSIGKSRMQGVLGTNPAAIPITVDNALSLSSTNPVQNRVITAAITNRLWSDEVKTALLQLAEKVAYIDADGQEYYDALYDALYPPVGLDSIGAVFDSSATIYTTDTLDTLKQYLTVTAFYSDGTSETVTTYTLSGSMDAGTQTITVAYGGKTTTFTVTIIALEVESVDAVFTQGSATIYDTDSLNTLRQYLVVTATYGDSTTATVSDYTLSGTLEVGTSAITVSYGGKTDTFDVVVTHYDPVRQVVYTDGTSIGKDTNRGTVYKQSTSARAAGAAPIENNCYVFTVTDSEKYNLAAYDVTSLEHITSDVPSSAIDGFMYQAGTKNVAWVTSDHVASEYVWLSLKKMDGTSFTAEELANGAEAIFTYTFSSFNPNTSPDVNLYIDTGTNKLSNAGSHNYHSTYVPITPNHSYKISKIVSNSFRIGLTAAVPAVGVSVLYTAANHSGTTMTVNVTQETAAYLVVTYIYDGTAAQNNNIRQSMTITEVVS